MKSGCLERRDKRELEISGAQGERATLYSRRPKDSDEKKACALADGGSIEAMKRLVSGRVGLQL